MVGEVIELSLRGDRSLAPASIVLPLAISDLPVFLRWRGEPPFGEARWKQLVTVADRVIVDSSEWSDLRYYALAEDFERTAISDIAWARTDALADRLTLAVARDRRARRSRSAGRGPRQSYSAAGFFSRLHRTVPEPEPAGELGVRLDGEEVPPPHEELRTGSDPAERRAQPALAGPDLRGGGRFHELSLDQRGQRLLGALWPAEISQQMAPRDEGPATRVADHAGVAAPRIGPGVADDPRFGAVSGDVANSEQEDGRRSLRAFGGTAHGTDATGARCRRLNACA